MHDSEHRNPPGWQSTKRSKVNGPPSPKTVMRKKIRLSMHFDANSEPSMMQAMKGKKGRRGGDMRHTQTTFEGPSSNLKQAFKLPSSPNNPCAPAELKGKEEEEDGSTSPGKRQDRTTQNLTGWTT